MFKVCLLIKIFCLSEDKDDQKIKMNPNANKQKKRTVANSWNSPFLFIFKWYYSLLPINIIM